MRKKYFINSLKKNKIGINKNYFANGFRDNQIKTKENIKKLLLNNKEITILLISSHTLASYIVDACRELDLKIGQDISLVSFLKAMTSIRALLSKLVLLHKQYTAHHL